MQSTALLFSDIAKQNNKYLSLVERWANDKNPFKVLVVDSKQAKIRKSDDMRDDYIRLDDPIENENGNFQISKADEEKRLVFGWALVSATADGQQIIDYQGDIVDQDELEEGAYEYVLNFRDAGEEHIGTLRKKARMVESVVFTEEKLQAMGIPLGTVPYGWWIGFYVDDDETWEKIKSGYYKMFSIEGKAVREPVDEPLVKSSQPTALSFSDVLKYNEKHDELGRFAPKNGGSAKTSGGRLGNVRNLVGGSSDNSLIEMWNNSKNDMSTEGIAVNSIIETELENRKLIRFNEDTFEYELTNDKKTETNNNTHVEPTNKSNTGVELSEQQQEYFKDSKVRDDNGNLVTLYHNSKIEGIEQFKTQNDYGYGGLYMSDTKDVATGYGGKATYEVYANLKNPYIIDADYKMHDSISKPNEMNYNSKTVDTFAIAAYARENGYDGVMIKNVKEPSSNKFGTDVIAFYPEQIKSVNNTEPTKSKNISKSDAEDSGAVAKTFSELMGDK